MMPFLVAEEFDLFAQAQEGRGCEHRYAHLCATGSKRDEVLRRSIKARPGDECVLL
jgi:hypothetical protein